MNLFRRKRYTTYTDEELMALTGQGEYPALDELYNRYSNWLLRYFWRMLSGDAQRGEDMLHDIFVKIAERPELFDSRRCFSVWVFSIAHNMCKNEYRTREVRKNIPYEFDELPGGGKSQTRQTELNDFRSALEAELGDMDEEHRTVFLLRHQQSFSIREIAATLGCPEGTVKSRLHYATRRLAERLKEHNPNTHENEVSNYERTQ